MTQAPNRLDCCRPFLRYTGPPEFYRWTHSNFCSVSPRLELDTVELDIAVPVPTPAYYSDNEQRLHQRRAEADLDRSGCPAHGGFKPWRDCPGCASEVLATKERLRDV